jgi:hypothetical protein
MIIFEENDDDRFYIAKSKIPMAGNGLFAAKPVKKNEFFFITGVMVERGSLADKTTSFLNKYKFLLRPESIDGNIDYGKYSVCPLGYASFVNHHPIRQNVRITYSCDENIKIPKHADQLLYLFIKDVEKDEEILTDYGYKPIESVCSPIKIKAYHPMIKKQLKN